MNKREAYKLGREHGYNSATWIDVPELGEEYWTDGMGRVTCDRDNIWDIMQDMCYESNMGSRDFSPWEFTAQAINESRDPDGYWDAYEEGVSKGIDERIREAMKAYAR